MTRSTFFVVTFIDSFGQQQASRTFATIRMARKMKSHFATFATNPRIMRGGPGGMEVQ
jgi:hypothetical protein